MLNDADLERYARQAIMPDIGEEGQARLLAARVLLVGAGGLGSPAGFYLAAAGIGHVTIIDDEQVETSNLNRQILHTTASVGMPKVAQAVQAMKALNPAMQVRPVQARLAADNVDALVTEHDLVVDCTDNAQTRFLLGGQRIGCGDRWSLAVPCVPKARLLCFKVVLRALNTPLVTAVCFPMRQMPALRPDARKPVFWGR